MQRDGGPIAQFLPGDIGAAAPRAGQAGRQVVDEDAGFGGGQVVGQRVAPVGIGVEPFLTGVQQRSGRAVWGARRIGACANVEHAIDEGQQAPRMAQQLWLPALHQA